MTFPVSPPHSKPLIRAYHHIDTEAVKETQRRGATMGGESERKQKAVGKKQSNKLRWAARQRQMESEQVRRGREGDRQKETIVSTYADESRGGGEICLASPHFPSPVQSAPAGYYSNECNRKE